MKREASSISSTGSPFSKKFHCGLAISMATDQIWMSSFSSSGIDSSDSINSTNPGVLIFMSKLRLDSVQQRTSKLPKDECRSRKALGHHFSMPESKVSRGDSEPLLEKLIKVGQAFKSRVERDI